MPHTIKNRMQRCPTPSGAGSVVSDGKVASPPLTPSHLPVAMLTASLNRRAAACPGVGLPLHLADEARRVLDDSAPAVTDRRGRHRDVEYAVQDEQVVVGLLGAPLVGAIAIPAGDSE